MEQKYYYQQNSRYFAQISSGLEELGIRELNEFGATDVKPGFRGIYFNATSAVLYSVNYESRLLTTVLAPLTSFQSFKPEYLYKRALQISWDDFMTVDQTFSIFTSVSHSKMNHSQYAGLKLKDAIVDYFKNKYNKRPDVDTKDPDIRFNLHIENNLATISFDTSGGSLHKRGYRTGAVEAPMRETLAAGILLKSDWDGTRELVDPMCGSGTILCEALMISAKIPSGYLRKNWGFFHLPDFDKSLWKTLKIKIDSKMKSIEKGLISGSDISSNAIRITEKNLTKLPFGDKVKVEKLDYKQISSIENKFIVMNPPYGIRLEKKTDLSLFYKELGDFLKHKCTNSTAYIFFGVRDYIKSIGLRTSMKFEMRNGNLDGRLTKYELY